MLGPQLLRVLCLESDKSKKETPVCLFFKDRSLKQCVAVASFDAMTV